MAQFELAALYRQAHVRAINEDNRTIDLSFSSEQPVERWFGNEILDHNPSSVRLDRLQNGAPLLADHDPTDVIGKVEGVSLKGGKGRATVRFGKSVRASEVWQDVKDGIRSAVSVGYRVFKATLEETANDGGLDTYRVTDWMPFEISLVSVPADASVGVGRSQGSTNILEIINMDNEIHMTRSERRRGSADTSTEIERVRIIRSVGAQCHEDELAEEFIREGGSIDLFQSQCLRNMKKPMADAGPLPGHADNDHLFERGGLGREVASSGIGMTRGEISQYSFRKAIMAQLDPVKYGRFAGFELEVSRAAEKEFGIKREGLHVPQEVLHAVISQSGQRDLSVGTTTAGGHTVSTDLLAQSFIELKLNKMRVREAGATILTGLVGNVAIPRQTGGATAFWVAEAVAATESQQAFDQLTLSPNTLGAFTDYSRKLLLQSTLDIEAFIRNDLATTLALEIDRVAINGSGTGAEPLGILNTTGIGDVAGGTNGLAPTVDHFVDLETDVAVANADIGALKYITNTKVRGKTKKTLSDAGSGEYVWPRNSTQVNGYDVVVTNQVPSNLTKGTSSGVASAIIFGNWADLVIGEWGGLSILVDPYTGGTSGTVRVIALQDVDLGLRHVASFSAMLDALTT